MNQGARTEEGRQARQRAAGADLLLGNLESSRPCGRYCDARLRLVAEQETVAPWRLWRLSPALICTFNVSFWPLDFPKLTQTGRKIRSDLRRSSPPGLQDLLLTSGWQVQQTFRGGGGMPAEPGLFWPDIMRQVVIRLRLMSKYFHTFVVGQS